MLRTLFVIYWKEDVDMGMKSSFLCPAVDSLNIHLISVYWAEHEKVASISRYWFTELGWARIQFENVERSRDVWLLLVIKRIIVKSYYAKLSRFISLARNRCTEESSLAPWSKLIHQSFVAGTKQGVSIHSSVDSVELKKSWDPLCSTRRNEVKLACLQYLL